MSVHSSLLRFLFHSSTIVYTSAASCLHRPSSAFFSHHSFTPPLPPNGGTGRRITKVRSLSCPIPTPPPPLESPSLRRADVLGIDVDVEGIQTRLDTGKLVTVRGLLCQDRPDLRVYTRFRRRKRRRRREEAGGGGRCGRKGEVEWERGGKKQV